MKNQITRKQAIEIVGSQAHLSYLSALKTRLPQSALNLHFMVPITNQ